MAREPAAEEASDACGGVGDPGYGADGFDVEVARVVEIFWQPEEIEVPGGVAEEFCGDDAPGFFEAQQIEPRDFSCGGGESDDWRKFVEILRAKRGMFARRVVGFSPPGGPEQAQRAGEEKNPAPV